MLGVVVLSAAQRGVMHIGDLASALPWAVVIASGTVSALLLERKR